MPSPLSECPLWVKSRHVQRKTSCPLYPQKRTFDGRGSAEATLYFSSKTFSMSRYKGRASARAVLTFAGLPPMRAIVCGAAFQIENN